MPYTAKQNKLFRAAEHNPAIAKKHGMTHSTAKKLAHEGVKKAPMKKPKKLPQKHSALATSRKSRFAAH